jgi:transcription antitermination factor NusG
MFSWYVATTHSQSELLASTNLKLQGFNVFNPRCRVQRFLRGRRIIFFRSYLPGYLFIEFDEGDEMWRTIHSTRGVRNVLSSGPEEPLKLKPGIVDELKSRCDGEGFLLEKEVDEVLIPELPSGSVVQIVEGPFRGFKGIVRASSQTRVQLILKSLLGGGAPMEMARENVRI